MSESEREKGEEKASKARCDNPAGTTPRPSPTLTGRNKEELTKAAPPPEPKRATERKEKKGKER